MSNLTRFSLAILAIVALEILPARAGDDGVTYRDIRHAHHHDGEKISFRPHRETPDGDLARRVVFEMLRIPSDPRPAEQQYYESTRDYPPSSNVGWTPDEWLDDNVFVGYFDLNSDGVDELIVRVEGISCGSGVSACDMDLFQRRNGAWAPIGKAPDNLEVLDERVDGYRTLWGYDMGARWRPDMDQYWGFCIDYETDIEEVGKCLEENG